VLGTAVPAAASATPPIGAAAAATAIAVTSKVSCGSAKSCLAVGVTTDNAGNTTAIAKAWNGTKWKSIAVRVPKGAIDTSLAGVSCKSASYCLAVGEYLTNAQSGNVHSFALTWNGTSLTATPAPPLPKGTIYGSLGGVSCVAVKRCVAVGASFASTPNTARALVETWNGAKWTLRTPPIPAGVRLALLGSVSCLSLTRCVVAGESISAKAATIGVIIATWNGKTLTPMKVPLPAGAGTPLITGVSCVSAARCAAVGGRLTSSSSTLKGFGFAEVWNGRAWTAVKLAWPKGTGFSFLTSVSCATARSCVGVGSSGSVNSSRAAAVSYNGRSWAVRHVPAPAKGMLDDFEGVSCASAANCVAVGLIGPSNGSSASLLSGIWNGRTWRLLPTK
jgi:hypothetical protein